jgi:hypothetical protein
MPVFCSKLLPPSWVTYIKVLTRGPCTQVQVTQDGGNNLPAKVFDSNFLLLVCRLGRALWETRTASGWRGYVWALKKNDAFRDSAQNILQTSLEMHTKECSHLHEYIHKCTMYLQAKSDGWKHIGWKKCRNYNWLYEQLLLNVQVLYTIADACSRACSHEQQFTCTRRELKSLSRTISKRAFLAAMLYMSSAARILWWFS